MTWTYYLIIRLCPKFGSKNRRNRQKKPRICQFEFDKFERVYSGHYHTRSDNGKVYYLGNPYEMYWNDVNDTRGFHIFDTDTLIHTPVNNPYKLFYNVYYEDTPHQTFDSTPYENKIVKVIVRKKSNPKEFERLVGKSKDNFERYDKQVQFSKNHDLIIIVL